LAILGSSPGTIGSLHVHDNHGVRDEHLWPGEVANGANGTANGMTNGMIDWPKTMKALKSLAETPAFVLEINYTLNETPASVTEKALAAFDLLT
jgi:sugar phosphate isomerase/epimerase